MPVLPTKTISWFLKELLKELINQINKGSSYPPLGCDNHWDINQIQEPGEMAGQGASLQNYNNELVKCIEDLREKREEINRQILKEEEEKVSSI